MTISKTNLFKLAFTISIASLLLIHSNNLQSSEGENKLAIKHDVFVSDVKGVKPSQLVSRYWKGKLTPKQSPLLTKEQIKVNNKQILNKLPFLTDLEIFPTNLNKEFILDKIYSISVRSKSNRYYKSGHLVSDADYKAYQDKMNLASVVGNASVDFALVVSRADLRSFPTNDKIYKTPEDINIDRFQETALFPTEAVAILHQTVDKNWSFVVSYNYAAWIETKYLAIGGKNEIFNYKNSSNFLVVTGDKVFTSFNPSNKQVSEVQLEMGIAIPLVEKHKIPKTIGGQNTYASYVVNLPTRTSEGKLKFEAALIPKNKDVNIGYLEFNKKNLIEQSFKFLGERYGWGHSFNARDCTGFVGEIYKSFGILMPRNSGQQGKAAYGHNIHFTKEASKEEKLKELKKLEVGDLIYIPGHVMMFLGYEQDQPFIIHDVAGMSYFKENGEFYKSQLNGVSVTPLLPLQLNQETSYLDRIYNIKKIR